MIFKKIPEELDQFEGKILISIVGKDERPLRSTNSWIDWRLYGTLSELICRGLFKCELGERCMLPTYGKFQFDRVVMVGGNDLFEAGSLPDTESGRRHWQEILRQVEQVVRSLKVEQIGLSLPRFESSQQEKALLEILKLAHLPNQTSLFLSRASGFATPLGI